MELRILKGEGLVAEGQAKKDSKSYSQWHSEIYLGDVGNHPLLQTDCCGEFCLGEDLSDLLRHFRNKQTVF